MYNNSKIASAVRAAIMFGAAAAVSVPAIAEETEKTERIQVTGSSIKRTDMEGALPITNISAEDIVKTGVTSVPDLIAMIPSMQGMLAPSQSVGGGGAGIASASLRGLGGEYTLVLLNGKRLAPSGSGSSVDVNSIPLAAIERVEILTDGASAIYGSDAIAGVINFILKNDIQETTVEGRFDAPTQSGGGKNGSFSITTGFGDLSSDGYNVYVSYSHESQEELASKDREHSKTGIIPFNFAGNDLLAVADSLNAIPANLKIEYPDGSVQRLNPYRLSNGEQCAENTVPDVYANGDTVCRFDFTSTLEIVPEYTRDNLLVGGVYELNDTTELYGTFSYSIFKQIARIAPYPTGSFQVDVGSDLFKDNVYPHLTADQITMLEAEVPEGGTAPKALANWRVLPGGNRTNEFATDSYFIDTGVRGEYGDISYDFSFNYSNSQRDDNILTGYPIEEEFMALLASGDLNVFGDAASMEGEQTDKVKATMFSGLDNSWETELMAISGSFSAPVFELSGGDAYIGGGFDYRDTSYLATSSESNLAAVILFASPTPQFDLQRESFGLFVEGVFPLFEGFEATAAIRYDDISAVTNTSVETGDSVEVGQDLDDLTYKLSTSYRPNDNWLLRASYGTGFKAPTMSQIAEPRKTFGVTGGVFACPFSADYDPLNYAQYCRDGNAQYNVYLEGEPNLKPEESTQVSVGFVYSPGTDFSVTVDYFNVELTNLAQRQTEANIMDNPSQYLNYFDLFFDRGAEANYLAIVRTPQNIGKANISGVDWTIDFNNDLGWAQLNTVLTGTYTIENNSLQAGSEDFYESSLGQNGADDSVVFRNKLRFVNTLTHGDFVHSVNLAYQSGFQDKYFPGGSYSIRLASDPGTIYDGGVQLRVPSHVTVDWLTRYNFNENTVISAGINNVFDKMPPRTLGENGGHQEGFDPRYFDSYGRTLYIGASYSF